MKFAVSLQNDLRKNRLNFGVKEKKKDWDSGIGFMRMCLFGLTYKMKPALLKNRATDLRKIYLVHGFHVM